MHFHTSPTIRFRPSSPFLSLSLSISDKCLVAAVSLILLWLCCFWNFFDDAYGLALKNPSQNKNGKKEMVRDRIILWCGAAAAGLTAWKIWGC
jgi:hypothetical protein